MMTQMMYGLFDEYGHTLDEPDKSVRKYDDLKPISANLRKGGRKNTTIKRHTPKTGRIYYTIAFKDNAIDKLGISDGDRITLSILPDDDKRLYIRKADGMNPRQHHVFICRELKGGILQCKIQGEETIEFLEEWTNEKRETVYQLREDKDMDRRGCYMILRKEM